MAPSKTIVLIAQNIMFLPRIMSVAGPLGYEVKQARTEADFWAVYEQARPELVLVDLEGDEETWPKVVAGVRQRGGDIRMVAFGPHADIATMEKARELGCNATYSKGQFNRDVSRIIQGEVV